MTNTAAHQPGEHRTSDFSPEVQRIMDRRQGVSADRTFTLFSISVLVAFALVAGLIVGEWFTG